MSESAAVGLLQDIDERAKVSWLKFCREMEVSEAVKLPALLEIIQDAYIGGYKIAMYDAVRIRIGLEGR